MSNKENKFKIDYLEEDLVNYYKNKFILEWSKQNQPEVLEEARLYAEQCAKEDES